MVAAFKKCDGVTEAKASNPEASATVTYDPAKTDAEKLLTAFKGNSPPKFAAFKKGAAPKAVFVYDGKEETLSGPLAIKAKDAGSEVVCRIVAKRNNEQLQRAINLIASSDLATKLEEIKKKGVGATVSGVVSEAGMKVTKVAEGGR